MVIGVICAAVAAVVLWIVYAVKVFIANIIDVDDFYASDTED